MVEGVVATRIILVLGWLPPVIIGIEPKRSLGGGNPVGTVPVTGRLTMIGLLPDDTFSFPTVLPEIYILVDCDPLDNWCVVRAGIGL